MGPQFLYDEKLPRGSYRLVSFQCAVLRDAPFVILPPAADREGNLLLIKHEP
jgi:hypothetical protein